MLHTQTMAPDYLSLMGKASSFDLSWALPAGVNGEQAVDLLHHFRNRFPIYDANDQTLHLNYHVEFDRRSNAVGFNIDPLDSIAVPQTAVSSSSSYVLPGQLLKREGQLMAFWHDTKNPPVLCTLSTGIEWMTAHTSLYYLPVIHEKSLAILPESGSVVLRLYRLDCHRLYGCNEAYIKQLQTRIVSAMQWLT